jgi:predicted phage-related endonuclease
MLTAEQLRIRDGKLTASRVACLMTGDAEKVMDLFREMTGDPTYQPEDLSGVWPVRMGEATEALNLEWYGRKTGHTVTRMGEVVVAREAPWAAATLDGFDPVMSAVIECKTVGGFEARERIVERYQPQCHWAMICTGTRKTFLSIIEAGREPVIEEITFDGTYALELWRRAEMFMKCVWDLIPPAVFDAVAAPVPPERWRTVSMEGNNAWAENASLWIEHRSASKKFDGASKELRAMVEADVGKATGHGVLVKRDRAGRLSISAER